jgi:serine/threonine protein kinase/predicted Zn-dependent protease
MSVARARKIFMELVAHVPAEGWQGRLAELAGADAELHGKVARLLTAHRQADSFLEQPASPLGSLAGDARAPAAPAGPPAEPGVTECGGTVIGPYKLLEQIGEGGFGVVFMALQQQPLRRKVAFKVIKPGMDSKHVIARFEAERQALALMDHPNIARALDAGTTKSGRPYFVMELVRGIPITEFCDQNRLTPRERLELFLTVCRAVQHAHQKGIIHRDLKPSNVLVTLLDATPVVKLIDFGIAKALGQERLTEKTMCTGFAQMIGTPLYMSPEQAEISGQDADTRTDIYSLGVLLYELLTGTTPFDRERLKEATYDEIRRIIREEEPAKPSTRISTLGQAATTVSANRKTEPRRLGQLFRGELDWIVMKALEKDRNRRYDTASSFAADLQRYLDDEPVLACPPSAGYRVRKFARKYRMPLSVGLVCVLVAMLAGGSLLWFAQKRSETAGAVQEAMRRAEDLQRQSRWPKALEAAKRAEALLRLGGGSTDLSRRVLGLVADLDMIRRLEDLLHPEDIIGGIRNSQDYLRGDSLYAEAFRNYGIDVDALEGKEAAERIRASHLRLELAAALDHWTHLRLLKMVQTGGEANWQHLPEVARAADPDPWRDQFRKVVGPPPVNKKIVQELAASPELASQPARTLYILGNYLASAGAIDDAVNVLRKAQQWHRDDFWINNDLAKYLVWQGQPVEALPYRMAAVAIRPQNCDAQLYLGGALMANGAPEEAIVAYCESIRIMPEDAPGAYINLGNLLAENGNLDEALAVYDKAIATMNTLLAKEPLLARVRIKLPNAIAGRAEVLIRLGRVKEAQQTYKELKKTVQEGLDANPSHPDNWFLAAPLRLQQGDVDGYRRVCHEMLARFSQTNNPEVAEQTAETCLLGPDAVTDLEPAVQLAERAITGNEQQYLYPWFLLTRGMADYRTRDFAKCIQRLDKTISLIRGSPPKDGWHRDNNPTLAGMAHLFMAMAYHHLDQANEARQALHQATQLKEQREPKAGGNKLPRPEWDNWLRFRIVYHEAEQVVTRQVKPAK